MPRKVQLVPKLHQNRDTANQAIEKYKNAKRRYDNARSWYAHFDMTVDFQAYIVEPMTLLIFLWKRMNEAKTFELVRPFPMLGRKYVSKSPITPLYNMHITIEYDYKKKTLGVVFHNATRNVILWADDGEFSWRQEGVLLPRFCQNTFIVNTIVEAVDNFIQYAQICHEVY